MAKRRNYDNIEYEIITDPDSFPDLDDEMIDKFIHAIFGHSMKDAAEKILNDIAALEAKETK